MNIFTNEPIGRVKLKTNFCPDCGCLLDLPGISDKVICNLCGYKCSILELPTKIIVTHKAFKLTESIIERIAHSNNDTQGATVDDEICQKCGHNVMTFHTVQLRSADEGQTVFYTCVNCGFRQSTNA